MRAAIAVRCVSRFFAALLVVLSVLSVAPVSGRDSFSAQQHSISISEFSRVMEGADIGVESRSLPRYSRSDYVAGKQQMAQFNGCPSGFCPGNILGKAGANGPSIDLNFETGIASGCSSLASCLAVTRASQETCTDASGAITYAANNAACITTAGLQVYGASTNIATQSQTHAAWTTTNATVSCGVLAPDGTSTACTITDNSTAGVPHGLASPANSANFTVGQLYTWSTYAKAGVNNGGGVGNAGEIVQITCIQGLAMCPAGVFVNAVLTNGGWISNASSTVISPGVQCWTTGSQAGWCRVWFSFVAVGTLANTRAMNIYMTHTPKGVQGQFYAGNSSTLLVWGAQVNPGPLRPYIPTVAANVSVPATQVVATGALQAALQASSMSAVFKTGAPIVSDGATNGAVLPVTIMGSNTLGSALGQIAGNQAQTAAGTGTLKINGQQFANYTANYIGLGCDATGRSVVLNGGVVASDSNVCGAISSANLGSLSDGTVALNSNILGLKVYGSRNDAVMKAASVNPTVPLPVAPYTGQIATGSALMSAISTTNKQFNSRSAVHFMDNASCVKFRLPNYYVNTGASGAETGSGAAATVTAALEYPAATFTQITFSASTSGSITDNGELDTDSVCPSGGLVAGTAGFLRVFWTSTAGIVQMNNNVPTDTANGEAINVAASGLSDLTLGGTVTNTASNGIYRPTAIYSTTTYPTACLVGDSRMAGYSDLQTDTKGDIGQQGRQIGQRYAYLGVAIPGNAVQFFAINHAKQAALGSFCTNAIFEYDVNDLYANGRSVAGILADNTTIYGLFPTHRKFQTTIMGESSSTDSFATSVNQTALVPLAGAGAIATLNSAIRAVPAPLIAYFEDANPLSTSQDSSIWITNGVATTYTPAGVHATQTGYLKIKANGGTNLSLIQ